MAEMQPPYQPGPPPQPLQPHRGVMVLIFGILSIVLGPTCCIGVVFGIIAWVFASQDLKAMDRGQMDPSGREMTRWGMILGIIGLALTVLSIVAGVFFGLAGVMQGVRHGFPR